MDNAEIVRKLKELEERVSKLEKQRHVDLHNVSTLIGTKADAQPNK